MRVCVFEDQNVEWLEPLTLTRPAFALRCGLTTLLARQTGYFTAAETGALVRPALAELCHLAHPQLAVNDLAWLRAGLTVLVNARWLPPAQCRGLERSPHIALVGDEVAYAVVPADQLTYCSPNTMDDCMETWKQTLPHRAAGGRMVTYPWDVIEHNFELIRQDFFYLHEEERSYRPANLSIVGPSEMVRVHDEATIEPMVVADTTRGPVVIDRGAVVHSFSRLEGPCHIGAESHILGAKVRASTIGPMCRVGGEVEASILQGYANKYHDGFLGHTYVGEWVNLAAGTQTSDLRNDYQPVTVTLHGRRVSTGLTKVGAFIGDHTKTGLNTLLNTGAVIGAFCNLLPIGTYLPRVVPSFTGTWHGQLIEQPDLAQLLTTAGTVMHRRGCDLTGSHAALYRLLFDQTAFYRRQVLREREQRRLRRAA